MIYTYFETGKRLILQFYFTTLGLSGNRRKYKC